jgi:HEAT repeat protein
MEEVMKNFYRHVAAGIVAVILLANISLAKDTKNTDIRFTDDKLKRIEKNLVIALESSSPTLQASAAMVLKQVRAAVPEYGFSSAVIPLMRMLKDEDKEPNVRIAAALALQDLKSSRGDFAIKRTAQFTDVDRVRHICSWLTYQRFKED